MQRQAEIVFRIQPMAGCHALQDFGAMLAGPRPKARRPVSWPRSAQIRRRMPRSSSVTNCGGVTRARSTFHHSSALSGYLPLRISIAEMALVGRPFQDVEQLLAGAGRPGFLLGDGNRDAAQVLDPGQHAVADPILRIAFLDGLEQHRGDVLAVPAHRAGAAADDPDLAALVLAERKPGPYKVGAVPGTTALIWLPLISRSRTRST
jgi:hypothetical protein